MKKFKMMSTPVEEVRDGSVAVAVLPLLFGSGGPQLRCWATRVRRTDVWQSVLLRPVVAAVVVAQDDTRPRVCLSWLSSCVGQGAVGSTH